MIHRDRPQFQKTWQRHCPYNRELINWFMLFVSKNEWLDCICSLRSLPHSSVLFQTARLPMARAPTTRFPVTRMPLIIRFALVPLIIVLTHKARIALSPSVRPDIAVGVLVPAMNPFVAIVTILTRHQSTCHDSQTCPMNCSSCHESDSLDVSDSLTDRATTHRVSFLSCSVARLGQDTPVSHISGVGLGDDAPVSPTVCRKLH